MDAPARDRSYRTALMTRNVAVVLLCLCVLAIVLLAAAVREREDKTLLLPPYGPEKYELSARSAGASYLEDMTVGILNALLTMTPETTDFGRRVLLRVADPRLRGALEARWSKVVGEVRKRKITTAFYPRTLRADVDAQAVVVRGDFVTFLGESFSAAEPRTYRLTYRTVAGRLWLTDLALEEEDDS